MKSKLAPSASPLLTHCPLLITEYLQNVYKQGAHCIMWVWTGSPLLHHLAFGKCFVQLWLLPPVLGCLIIWAAEGIVWGAVAAGHHFCHTQLTECLVSPPTMGELCSYTPYTLSVIAVLPINTVCHSKVAVWTGSQQANTDNSFGCQWNSLTSVGDEMGQPNTPETCKHTWDKWADHSTLVWLMCLPTGV